MRLLGESATWGTGSGRTRRVLYGLASAEIETRLGDNLILIGEVEAERLNHSLRTTGFKRPVGANFVVVASDRIEPVTEKKYGSIVVMTLWAR